MITTASPLIRDVCADLEDFPIGTRFRIGQDDCQLIRMVDGTAEVEINGRARERWHRNTRIEADVDSGALIDRLLEAANVLSGINDQDLAAACRLAASIVEESVR